MEETIGKYLLGGVGGAIITQIFNYLKNRIQKMECCYIDEDIMSKLPITIEDGTIHSNIYTKQFVLKNTTNLDHKEFRVIFEFDATSKILKITNISKTGSDKLRSKMLKDNECSFNIRNFNRGDEIKFIFEIANITNNYINVTEDNCIGFKIKNKDRRKNKKDSKLTFVSKEQIHSKIN